MSSTETNFAPSRELKLEELDAVTGGADTQTEQKTLSMLSSMVSTVIKTTGEVLGTAIR